ncbi:ArsA family ATPase [Marinimicrobium sp. ABcell2]|uniref:ArsA family ATPase n=1 Tax=Marinimicrobium sp. ABcell2 TaxID=3069751 RepID=UPI0027B21FF3|nr:ArsA family ATPase [Marinimicrobium sp. ABcell2]MDQ2076435.1 ArsA family ATPase [Marinimicrobium sp. ABcell2]
MTTPILFFGGKGGVGKTTLAAATALGLAQLGRRTLLISTDPAHSLSDLLDQPLGDQATNVAANLWVRELDPDAAREHYLAAVKDNIRRFAAPEFLREAERQVELAGMHPGATESALFEALCRQLDELEQWDHIIVDTAPTGHTLHLLTLPESMQAWTQALLAHQLDARPGNLPERDDPRRRARDLLQARQDLFQRTRTRLQDPRLTGFVLVVNDDRLSVSEGVRARETLERARVSIPALIINRTVRPESQVREAVESRFPKLTQVVVPAAETTPQGLADLKRLAVYLQDAGLIH